MDPGKLKPLPRIGYSPVEVGGAFNRTGAWALKKMAAGAIKSFEIDGSRFVPTEEIERLQRLAAAAAAERESEGAV
jgi:hypothetical protein